MLHYNEGKSIMDQLIGVIGTLMIFGAFNVFLRILHKIFKWELPEDPKPKKDISTDSGEWDNPPCIGTNWKKKPDPNKGMK